MDNRYDVIIIGAGPAGCTAALYCGRAALKTLLIEKMSPGGQMATTEEVDNYPGFPKGINGGELSFSMLEQAEKFGAKTVYDEVASLSLKGDVKTVQLANGQQLEALCIILAMGAEPRLLGAKGEDKFRGRGVSYCATCDGGFFKGKTVAVVGGGDTAAADAIYLSKICSKVYLIHRRDTLRASRAYKNRLESSNVEFLWNTTVEEIGGEEKVSFIKAKNGEEMREIKLDGVFIAVGITPGSGLIADALETDEQGYILADEGTKTSQEGVFVCGDIRKKPLRQIVTAVSDGAVAAYMAQELIDMK